MSSLPVHLPAAAPGSLLLGFSILAVAQSAYAQDRPDPAADSVVAACASPPHRAFDFWIGSWDVSQADGSPAGENRITRVLGGCALHEHWRGADGSRGNSYSLYDRTTQQWHQQWVDIGGNLLRLVGSTVNGAMVLEADNQTASGPTRSRITWSRLPDGRVRQHWELSRDGGTTWQTHFDGYYRRKPEP